MRQLFFHIAGLKISFLSQDPDLDLEVEAEQARFMAGELSPEVTLPVRWADLPAHPFGRRVRRTPGTRPV